MRRAKNTAALTDRQLKAIPHIVSSPTYTEGCEKAKINKTTLYKWLRERDEITAEAFGVLSQGLTKAVDTLVGLLDNKDDRLKRLTAKDIIDFIIRHKEVEDLDKRLAAVEQRLESQRR
jgi:AcrR family transcriptional regulator